MRFIKWIISKFKELFSSKKANVIQSKTDLPLSNLIPKLAEVDQDKLFDEIEAGDVVIATTSGNYEKLSKIKKNHQLRPYIIANKKENCLIGYCGTSKDRTYKSTFKLLSSEYDISKDGNINIGTYQKIHKDMLVSIQDHLSMMDILKINDTIWNTNSNKAKGYIEAERHYCEGQIIRKDNRLYYIYSLNSTATIIYKLHKVTEHKKIIINYYGQMYSLYYQQPIECDSLDAYVPTAVISTSIRDEIRKMNNQQKKKEKAKETELLKDGHYFKYEVGQLFGTGTINSVYLFSNSGKDYCVVLDANNSIPEYPRVEKMDDISLYSNHELLSEDATLELLESIACNQKCYMWLLDELTTFEEDAENMEAKEVVAKEDADE